MLESFLNPGYVLAGAALVSIPIIIHLINRFRFKKVRWAAMEFLLKSQKRNRRRLIIEQLLLLALRCLLVLMAVLLVSRYAGLSFAFFQPQNTVHIVLVDDSLSTTDHWREEGEENDSFKIIKNRIVREIAQNAGQARSAQRLVLLFLSEPGTIRFDQRLNDTALADLLAQLQDVEPTMLRLTLQPGLEAAKAIFDKSPLDQRILHLISDFRQRDWGEPEVSGTEKLIDSLARAGVRINMVDTAHPFRTELQRSPLYHDNLAILELKPDTRISAKDLPVQFRVTVANYGAAERANQRVTVKVNGGERLEGSMTLSIPPGGAKSETFQITLDQLGFNLISVNLETEEVGLQADNSRFAVVEVRRQVPILMVDGDPASGLKPGGDTFHMQTLFAAARGFQIDARGAAELEQPTIDRYASIYLFNVRSLSDRALRNLQEYVADGGSVAFFMGERVDYDFYNKKLFAGGKGIFPAPLADRPFPPLNEPELEPSLFNQQPKIYVRDEKHPIFAEVWQPGIRGIFNFLPIKRYYPVARRSWNPEPGVTEELVTLPNDKAMRDYVGLANSEVIEPLNELINDPKLERYRTALERHRLTIQNTLLGDKPLYELAIALESLLKDAGSANDPQKPSLIELWSQDAAEKIARRIEKLRQTVQLGDPLVVASKFGKGRVVAVLTTAGRAWNDWAGGSVASVTYPPVMLEMQKYLTSGGPEQSLSVGVPLEIQADSNRYDAKMHRYYMPELRDAGAGSQAGGAKGLVDLKEQIGSSSGGRVTFTFDEARKPGMYLFELAPLSSQGTLSAEARAEQRAYAFNVDTAESDLRRASRDELERFGELVKVRSPGSGWAAELANRRSDLSESPWFYLVFLVLLIAEQALAVHLSFHLSGNAAAPPAIGKRAAASKEVGHHGKRSPDHS